MYNNQDNVFVSVIDTDGTIYQYNSGRKGAAVGVDRQREEELLKQIEDMSEVINRQMEKLIEHGIVEKPRSAEDIAREAAEEQLQIAREQATKQAEINETLLKAVQSLTSEINTLKNDSTQPKPVEAKSTNAPKNKKVVTDNA